MTATTRSDRAARFRTLHTPGRPLVLANAWDAASARITEAAGVGAVATTSAGVAWSLGAPDGDGLGRPDAIAAIARIVAAVEVPVTADIESGYAGDPDGVGETVRAVLAAGAVGVNLEDAWHAGDTPLREPNEQAQRISAARKAAGAPDLFLNVRTDTYLRGVGDPDSRLAETLTRARAYLDAGADGIFVPGVTDPVTIAALVEGIDAPLNVMVGPGSPSVSELAELGVARVSLGAAIASAAYGLVQRAAREALESGTYCQLDGAIDYGELNGLLSDR